MNEKPQPKSLLKLILNSPWLTQLGCNTTLKKYFAPILPYENS